MLWSSYQYAENKILLTQLFLPPNVIEQFLLDVELLGNQA